MLSYYEAMIDASVHRSDPLSVEDDLRAQLARGDAVAGSVTPILRHLLAVEDNTLFSEEIVARVRGMLADLAGQLIGKPEETGADEHRIAILAALLAQNTPLLTHAHALALEWRLTERLHARLSLDTVLSPLMQSLIASPEAATSALAMTVLAAQARFCQSQRRMQLPLTELPADLLHVALVSLRGFAGSEPATDTLAAGRETEIRQEYDEGATRLAMLSRLVAELDGGAIVAIRVPHAGCALFLSALATGAGLDRDAMVLATHETQRARLALALRRAGLETPVLEEQLLSIDPDLSVPDGIARISIHDAGVLLSESGALARP